MPYFRESHYTKKMLVGFTEDQRTALDKVSAQKGRSLAGVVRDAVDLHSENNTRRTPVLSRGSRNHRLYFQNRRRTRRGADK